MTPAYEGVYVVSVFLSAFLLFALQPMLARMLLPVYGGSPAVWNTCMVFFQILLLAGYAYAHTSLRRLRPARQAAMHATLLVASLLFLPRALSAVPPASSLPVPSILLTLATIAGIPFFLLSSNSSLTQHWFSLGPYETSADPFWLYAASNAGSLVALLSYPLIVEPVFGLDAQRRMWSVGYAAFVALSALSMFLARNVLGAAPNADQLAQRSTPLESERGRAGPVVTIKRRFGWLVRSAIASSLLLSVTMEITTDVISAPLFWVLPLALYLATFIVAFGRSRRPPRRSVAFATMIGIALCFVLLIIPTALPLWFALLVLLGTLFAGALLCNGEIADDRPSAAHLTDFYLWVAVGGMVGGVVNSIIAPMVFNAVVEYPITLVCLALLLPSRSAAGLSADTALVRLRGAVTSPSGLAMVGATAIAAIFVVVGRAHGVTTSTDTAILRWQFMPVAVLIGGVLFASEPGAFALSAALTAGFTIAGLHFIDPIVDQGRSFFGVSRVTENASERIMLHGVTVHGEQRRDPVPRDVPTSYYFPAGPLGWNIDHAPPGAVMGVIGLGAGSLAPLAVAGQRLTYYEIDPLVERMARRDFTYLSDSRARVDVQIGDGRRLLDAVGDDHFDLLVVDAFTSDAIPTHLLTDEALAVYLRKLKPTGLVVIHISNRYADLQRVFRGWRHATGQRVVIDQYVPSKADEAQGVRTTVAVALARSPAAFARLASTKEWYWLDDDGPSVHWTDDHVNLLGVLDRNILRP